MNLCYCYVTRLLTSMKNETPDSLVFRDDAKISKEAGWLRARALWPTDFSLSVTVPGREGVRNGHRCRSREPQ